MADEKQEVEPEKAEETGGKKGKKKLIILVAAVLVLGGGGFFGYTKFLGPKQEAHGEEVEEKRVVLFPMSPLILNLAEGRFLKLTAQFQLVDASYEHKAAEKVPQIQDTIITFISSKSVESIATPEGKLQLKDEILLRANQVVGENVFNNLYFTEFMTQ